ncbi:MAG: hypothetical protein AB8G11_21000 [Saprospiraceae bacterium]
MIRYSLILILTITIITGCKNGTPSEEDTKIPPSSVAANDEDAIKTVEGTIYELMPIYIDEGGLEIFMEDKDGKEVYLDFYRDVNPAKYDAFPVDLEVEIQAFYKTKKQQVALDIQTLGKIGGKAVDDYKDMVVYMVKGTQTKVEEKGDGLLVTIETSKGTELQYIADTEVYMGAKPEAYNDKTVEVIYMEDEQWLMQDYELITEGY